MKEDIRVSEKAVKEAAVWLDGVDPGWHRRIDKKTLNMAHCDKCIYGQLHGDYLEGYEYYQKSDIIGQKEAA